MIHKAIIVALPVLLLGPGCRSPGAHATPTTGHDGLPALEIDEALAVAREAAASEYEVELYTVDGCVRDVDCWRISFAPRHVDKVGAGWSHAHKEEPIALGNHFSVYVYDDHTVRLFGGR